MAHSKTAPGIAPGCVTRRCDIERTCKKVGFCCARTDSNALMREYLDREHSFVCAACGVSQALAHTVSCSEAQAAIEEAKS